jgi:transposase InsO family protein
MARKVTALDVKLLVATLPEGTNLSAWCRRLGITRPTAYKWRARYRAEGIAGLEDRSRAPARPHGRSSAEVEDAVVAARKQLAEEGLDCGPASVQSRLLAQGLATPSESTIWRISVRRGLVVPAPAKRPRVWYRRFTRERPNECWQADDTHYLLASDQEVRIINLLDDHSRLNVDSLAVPLCRSERVWESFSRAIERYGVPAEFLNDNGRAYVSPSDQAPVLFQAHLARLGVRQIRSSPFHPQTCGKVERFHQTQRRWLRAQPVAATVAELQGLLDRFRVTYNELRPHRALGRRPPIEVWRAQPPAVPADIVGPDGLRIRFATAHDNGNITTESRSISIGLGVAWANRSVVLLLRGDAAMVIDHLTGEIVRELTIDRSRRYQPSGRRRGGPRQERRNERLKV